MMQLEFFKRTTVNWDFYVLIKNAPTWLIYVAMNLTVWIPAVVLWHFNVNLAIGYLIAVLWMIINMHIGWDDGKDGAP